MVDLEPGTLPATVGCVTEAALRSTRPTRGRVAFLASLWTGLEPELDRAGLDHVSEVFDGEAPHRPGGSFAQAWNTAEWLRARKMLAERRPSRHGSRAAMTCALPPARWRWR